MAYSHLLFQLSELYEITGKHSESSEYLSSAMKALNAHQENPLVFPFVGKTLRQIGFYHMSNMQAVTSEGLFRASMEKLSSPFAEFDYRYQYELFVTQGLYGKLLAKWERREADGEKNKKEAMELLKGWQKKNTKEMIAGDTSASSAAHQNNHVYPLTSLIQFPVDFL
jgi:hypothetical protein